MPKRASFTMFLGLVTIIVLTTGISAGAAPQGDAQATQVELGSAQDRLDGIRQEAGVSYEKYNNALSQLNKLDDEIAATARDLDKAEVRLAKAQGNLEDRASQVYRSGNVAFLDVLVGANDFSDFASRLDLWMRLLGQERDEFDTVLQAKNELAVKQSRLKDQRDQRAAAVADAADQKEQAENAQTEAQAYLDSLNAGLQAAIKADAQKQAEAARAAAEKAVEAAPKVEPRMVQVAQVEPAAPQEASKAEAPKAAAQVQVASRAAPQADFKADQQAADQRVAERADARAAAEQAAAEAERQAKLAQQEAAAQEKADARAAAEQLAEKRRAAAEQARAAAEQAAIEEAAAQQAAQQAAAQQAAAQQAATDQAAADQAAADQAAEEAATQQAAVQQPAADPAGAPQTAPATSSGGGGSASGGAVVAEAETWLGTPYVWGGTSRSGVDCSGLTMMVYAQFGVSLPRTAAEQFGAGAPVSSPAPGDLVFFGGGSITSVGIVTGPDTAIKATVPGDVVRYVSISEVGNATGGVAGYRRVL